MKVSELIKQLERFNDEANSEVVVYEEQGDTETNDYFEIKEVVRNRSGNIFIKVIKAD